MKLLFLDIDGPMISAVAFRERHNNGDLNGWRRWGNNHKKLLEYLLQDNPDLYVILSSTWRYGCKTVEDVRDLFRENNFDEASLQQVIGRTGVSADSRGEEIKNFLYNNPNVTNIAILDDDSDMGDLAPYLVKVSFENGFLPEHVPQILEVLNKPYKRLA